MQSSKQRDSVPNILTSHGLGAFQMSIGQQAEISTLREQGNNLANVSSLSLHDIQTVNADVQSSCRVIFHTDPLALGSDRFRFLRMHLREHRQAGRLKTLLITSPLPNEGKSTVAINLATALSEGGKVKVLLIEADLHRPTLIRQLGLQDWDGLSQVLQGNLRSMQAIRMVEPLGWYLLPAGAAAHNPTELLQSAALGHLKQELLGQFDWILIDSPPALPLTDAISLRQHADGILLVVKAGETPQDAVEDTVALLGKQHIAAIVLNGVPDLERSYYKYGYR